MVYSTTRCPQCGQIIRKQTNPCHEIASPFERCRHCGGIYLNSYKEEWITKSPLKRILYFVQDGVWARAFFIPFLIAGILGASFEAKTSVIFFLWFILAVLWLVLGYFMHKDSEQEIVESSIKRTQDPNYVNLLKQAGYKIYPIKRKALTNHPQPTSEPTVTTPKQTIPSHICTSPANESTINAGALQPQPQDNMPENKCFSVKELADGLAEMCVQEIIDIMGICGKHNVPYNQRKIVVSTFAYFYSVWVCNFATLTLEQTRTLESLYKEAFCMFNRKQFENFPFEEIIENERMLEEQLQQVSRRVLRSRDAASHTFVDDGISDEFILEFINRPNDKDLIKMEIVLKVLSQWAHKAMLAGKAATITST